MRINVYAEELLGSEGGNLPRVELVTKTAETGRTYYGVRIFLKSPPELHAELVDDDRSAITIWGPRGLVYSILREAADKISTRPSAGPNGAAGGFGK